MKSTQIDRVVKNALKNIFTTYPVLTSIVNLIVKHKGRVLLVGGAVRDILLEVPLYDLDCQVHNIAPEELEKLLSTFGHVDIVGRSFGVFKIAHLAIDWSLPRSDSSGRKPYVEIDPFMDIKESFARRDLTINAIGIDLFTGEIIDPFDGIHDLNNKILRSPDIEKFSQDPLRFYRVMQFIGRLTFTPDDELNKACRTINLADISLERIAAEYEKLLLKSERPSRGFRWINQLGRLEELLPELAKTKGVPQNPVWHPEGDVFEHTMQAVDAAATLVYEDDAQKVIILFAALCHDLGKVTATTLKDDIYKSKGHEVEGVPFAKKLLHRMTKKKELMRIVLLLVRYHMEPLGFISSNAGAAAYKRLAFVLSPLTNIYMLALLCLADKRGRNGTSSVPLEGPIEGVDTFIEAARAAGVLFHKEEPVLQGRDLITYKAPGPQMGALLNKAYKIQINKGVTDKQELLRRVLQSSE